MTSVVVVAVVAVVVTTDIVIYLYLKVSSFALGAHHDHVLFADLAFTLVFGSRADASIGCPKELM